MSQILVPKILSCTQARHASAILDIFNDAILTSTALYDYQPRTLANMEDWFVAKQNGEFPVVGLENDQGQLIAFGSYGSFRPFPAYKYSVEHSVYVHKDHRGKGFGTQVMQALILSAQQQGKHALIGAIDAANLSSIALHKRLGFQHIGTLPQVGFKFGKWLDLSLYQLLLETPLQPKDG